MATSNKNGNDFLIDTTTTGDQFDPTIHPLDNGDFVVVWQDYSESGGDTSGSAVRGQPFSRNGSKAGSEFLVNTTTSGSQLYPSITALANGGFVVAWVDTSDGAVRGQMFSITGSKAGSEFIVTTTTNVNFAPAVAPIGYGDFVVVWTGGGDTSATAVRGQMFSGDGRKVGPEFLVNTTTSGAQFGPSISDSLNGASFVVVWTDNSQSGGDTSGTAVRGQIFSRSGRKVGSEFLVNTTTSGNQSRWSRPSITSDYDMFVVVWENNSPSGGDNSLSSICGQIFGDDGSKFGDEFLVTTTTSRAQLSPSVTFLANGFFVVVWTDNSRSGGDTSAGSIRGQMFSRFGDKHGDEFLVNTTTSVDQSWPKITALPEGRFVVVWEDASQSSGDTSGSAVRGQIFSRNGDKDGSEFLVNTTTSGYQGALSITCLR